MTGYYTIKDDSILINLKIITHAAKNQIVGIKNNELVIKIRGIPEKGKANDELVGYLSKSLYCPRSDILITRGETSRHKQISLPSLLQGRLNGLLFP